MIAGVALALSATAIALQILEERGQLQQVYGQRAFAILLFQDMAVVPLLALLPLLGEGGANPHGDPLAALRSVALIAAAIALVVAAGRYLLNPAFRLLAATGAREVMTAAALLVVLGAALIMQAAGMSMALGAFLAGVLLAESNYRHELEADIEPFRGLLLALFFMGIGMTIDMNVVQPQRRADPRRRRRADRAQGRDRVPAVSRDLRPRGCAARRIGAHRRRRVRLRAGAARSVAGDLRCRAGEPAHRHCGHHHDAGAAGRRPVGPGAAPTGRSATSSRPTISPTPADRCW